MVHIEDSCREPVVYFNSLQIGSCFIISPTSHWVWVKVDKSHAMPVAEVRSHSNDRLGVLDQFDNSRVIPVTITMVQKI